MKNEHDTAAALDRLQAHLPELVQYFVVDPRDSDADAVQEDAA